MPYRDGEQAADGGDVGDSYFGYDAAGGEFQRLRLLDPDGSIACYAWTFGDGGTGSGATASHTYTTAGTFTATLKVTDNLGATGTATTTITANPNSTTIAAPSGLTASASNRVVTLKWTDNSTNKTGFYIERAPSGTTS